MEGVILGFDRVEGMGVVRGEDGRRYRFARGDWRSEREPLEGQGVDFVPEGDEAREVYLLTPLRSLFAEKARDIETSEKTLPMLVYVLYVAAFAYGVTMVVGAILAYANRDRARGTWLASHYEWQIGTFWRGLVGVILGVALLPLFGLGFVVLGLTYLWLIFRIVRGLSALSEGRPVQP